eukprot:1120785-Rhodomonas_salina.2
MPAHDLRELAYKGRLDNEALLRIVSLWSSAACHAVGDSAADNVNHDQCVAAFAAGIKSQGQASCIATHSLCTALQDVYARVQQARLRITTLVYEHASRNSAFDMLLPQGVYPPTSVSLMQQQQPTVAAWLATGLSHALELGYIAPQVHMGADLTDVASRIHCTAVVSGLQFMLAREVIPVRQPATKPKQHAW